MVLILREGSIIFVAIVLASLRGVVVKSEKLNKAGDSTVSYTIELEEEKEEVEGKMIYDGGDEVISLPDV